MTSILSFFWQLCLLRSSPAQLPASNFATGIVFVIYVCIALTVISLIRPDQSFTIIASDIAIGMLVQVLVTLMLLSYKGFVTRFRATWSALMGTNAVMLLVLLPVHGILMNAEQKTLLVFADSLTWICLGWWLAIAGYIYHKSVNISVIQGSVIAFLVEFLAAIIAFNLIPR